VHHERECGTLDINSNFAAGFLYSRYGTGFFGSSIKPGYLSNMDSIYVNSKRWCSSHSLTQEGLAESAIASELKSTTASAVDVIRAALGDKTDTFLNLVKEYNRGRSIPVKLVPVKVYFIVADPDWGVKAEEHYVVDENKPLRALESLKVWECHYPQPLAYSGLLWKTVQLMWI